MTERKPPDVSFTSWVDQQINEAMERGAFDNLPGAGKPLPKRTEADEGQAWLRDWLRREGVSTEELLPPPLKLRKETHRLKDSVLEMRSEVEVRQAVADLNKRIMEWRRIPIGPPIFVPLLDQDEMVCAWRSAQADPPSEPAAATVAINESVTARPRWWRRRGRDNPSGRSTR